MCNVVQPFRHYNITNQVKTETNINILIRIIDLEAHLTDAEPDSDTDYPLLAPI